MIGRDDHDEQSEPDESGRRIEMPPRPLRIVVDCDPGVDDAMALFFGVLSDDVEIVAIGTVWGNSRITNTTANALRLLEIAGAARVPIAMGAGKPLLGPAHDLGRGPHGSDGLGDTDLPPPHGAPTAEAAATQLVRLAHRYPGELTLITLGPLTNVALALLSEPDIARLYREVVIMGGAMMAPGNLRSVVETNVGHDPEAAQVVLDAGWPITLVGLDVTERVRVPQSFFDDLRDHAGVLGETLSRISARYMSFYQCRYGKPECPIHDALALGIAADRSVIRSARRTRVDVELYGQHTRGMTVAEMRTGQRVERANVDVVLDVDGARFIQRYTETLRRIGGTGN